MSATALRPPLPENLSHEGIRFVFDPGVSAACLPSEIIVAIAACLNQILPQGDLRFDSVSGMVNLSAKGETPRSVWFQSGLLEGIERSRL